MVRYLKLGIVFIVLLTFWQCSQKAHAPVQRTRILLGTFVKITSYDQNLSVSHIQQAIDTAFSTIQNMEHVLNTYDSTSFVSQINRAPANQPFPVPAGLLPLFNISLKIARETEGAFDVTIWSVFRLWHFGTDSAAVPDAARIQEALRYVGWQNISWHGDTLRKKYARTQLDFSGISKGYVVELARRVLKQKGLKNFIIDAGGNLGIEWHRPDSVKIYIRHPRQEGKFWGYFLVDTSCGIATSGDYQNYFMKDSVRYHHILDPRTGYPVRHTVSTTILAPNATLADGYSTAIFVLGPHKGLQFLNSHPQLQGVIVYSEKEKLKTVVSAGLNNKFHFMKDE